ncbi:MAG TPA: penicillin-binding protein 2 [Casimicrobiaceae bacterium]|nr:penicillin-binding protein 2 [Casimicrobiaceae bacterium]
MRATHSRTNATPKLPRLRAPLVFGGLLALLVGLLGRSLYLQRIDHDFLQEQGSSRYSRDIDVPAHRGRIVDRFGEPLAISTPVKAVWAWPDQVVATSDQLRALAAALEMTPALLNQKLAQGGDFVYVKRPVAPEVADRAAALKVKGVHDESEYWRYYPGGEVMSHIVGFTGDRDVGQEGLELAQQSWLGGKPGSRRVIINRRGEIVEDIKSIRAPQEGRDLALSIDSRLQYLAFREIKAAVDANKAHAGAAVMLDVKSGEILALVNWPSYNPNNRMRTTRDRMRNRALIDTFEPGSTLKPFTIAAALDAGKVRPGTIIDTAPGTLTIGHATIHDAHREGALTVEQVIQKSSNVGAAKIALSLPAETMWQTLSATGFGAAPMTGFPGEVSGRLRPAKSWRPIEQATMAYGHGISVNLVQLARAYTVFATDGELKPVSLLKVDGAIAGRPVISADTARAVRRMLEMAVSPGGTAPKAQVAGYRVAGKTGTAHKLEGRAYVDKYVSSFVGFAPASNPRLVIAVMIDEPGGMQYYGGAVAAPVFSSIMGAALHLLGIPADAPIDNVVLPPDGADVREET